MPPRKLTFTRLDLALLVGMFGLAGWFGWRIAIGLDYDWNWPAVGRFLLRYDEEAGRWVPNLLLRGLFTTIKLSIWATLLATVAGVCMGLCRTARGLFPRLVGGAYVESVRNLPPLVLLFIFYFFLSDQLMTALDVNGLARSLPETWQTVLAWIMAPPQRLGAFISAVLALAVYEGAYITEIVRAGVQSVEKGQREAAQALGLSPWQTLRHVVMPLTAQRIMPPLAGQFISTIKDSSIVAVISMQELTFQGLELMASTYRTFEIWITVALLYLSLTLTCSLLARRLELYLRRSED